MTEISKTTPLKRKLKNKFELLQKYLAEQQFNTGISNLLENAFDLALSAQGNVENLSYLDRLVQELLSIESVGKNPDTTINHVLLYLNFNSRKYFIYHVTRIEQELRNEETLIGKLESLAFIYKKVNQIILEPNVRFDPTLPSITDMISNWISEEISFLERKLRLSTSVANTNEQFLNKDFKIALEMSVAQFSCLVRGLMESKIILNNNLTEFASSISKLVVTKRSENISEGSFRRKYYNVEESTKKSVIELLNRTIDWLMHSN